MSLALKYSKQKIPLYTGYLCIYFCDDFEFINKKYKLNLDMQEYKDCDAMAGFKESTDEYYVVLNTETTFGIIAHECKHVLNNIYIKHGIELDRYNDEPECYLLKWLVNCVVDTMKKDYK